MAKATLMIEIPIDNDDQERDLTEAIIKIVEEQLGKDVNIQSYVVTPED